jgi:thiol-disulfide isomerase/thioredoxin
MPPVDPRVQLRLDAIEVVPVGAPVVPHYRFEPGTRLQYIIRSERDAGGAPEYALRNLSIYPVRANPDGTWRLILVERETEQSVDSATGTVTAAPGGVYLAWCDLAPDGRYEKNFALRSRDIAALFVPLPADEAEAQAGWRVSDAAGFESRGWREAGFAREGGQLVIRGTGDGTMNAVYETGLEVTALFDTAAGRIVEKETRSTTAWRQRSETRIVTALAGVTAMPKADFTRLTGEAEGFIRAWMAWDTLTDLASERPAEADSLNALADSALTRARAQLTEPDLVAAADNEIADFRQYLERMAQRPKTTVGGLTPESLVGKAAPDWKLKSLDGKDYSLKGLRGKVLVLDFWYRGCPWCIRAMPALKQLAAEFAGKPVQVLGMNVDSDTADARFTVEKLGLDYPSLLAGDVPKNYHVSGYPTLFVIDRKGNVAEALVGYDENLHETLGRRIGELLEAR